MYIIYTAAGLCMASLHLCLETSIRSTVSDTPGFVDKGTCQCGTTPLNIDSDESHPVCVYCKAG